MKAIVYLHFRLIINSLKYLATSPRRIIPAIIIGFIYSQWIFSMFVMSALRVGSQDRLGASLTLPRGMAADAVWSIVFTVLSVVVVWVVYNALSDGLLIFRTGDIDFLFPTPVSRRAVLSMKLLGDAVRYWFYVGIVAFIAGIFAGLFVGGSYLLTVWAAILFLVIFATNITHTISIVANYGVSRLSTAAKAFRWSVLALVVAALGAAVYEYMHNPIVWQSAVTSVSHGPVRIMLLPVTWCTDVVLAPFLPYAVNNAVALGGLLVLSVVSAIVLLYRPENFYEPSLGITVRMSNYRAARMAGDMAAARKAWRKEKVVTRRYSGSIVPGFGTGATALLWKNLTVSVRNNGIKTVVVFVVALGGMYALGQVVDVKELQMYSPFVMLYIIWGFVMASQVKVRSEFQQIEIIKSMPVSTSDIVRAWMVEMAIQIIVTVGVLGLGIKVFLPAVLDELLILCCAASCTAGLAAYGGAVVSNLLYPDFKDKLQQTVYGFVMMFIVGICILPSIIVVSVLHYADVSIVADIAALIIINALIIWGETALGGYVLRRFDPTN